MKHDDDDVAAEVRKVTGQVVMALLEPGKTLHLHQIIGRLWRMGNSTDDARVREACLEAIRLLARKMH